MTDDRFTITPRIDGVTESVPRTDFNPTQAEVVESFLEKYFSAKLSAGSAPDGSIEFYTADGKLFARVDSNGVVSVETSDSSYSFSTEEILEAGRGKRAEEKDVCEDTSGSESKGRKVVVNGEYVGVEDDGEYPQSIPADVAVDIYTEEEIVELERESGISLRRAALRYAESATSDEIKSGKSEARETPAENSAHPRETDAPSREEVPVAERESDKDTVAVFSPGAAPQEGAPVQGHVEQQAPSGVNPAPYTPANVTADTSAHFVTAQVASSFAFVSQVHQQDLRAEKNAVVAERRASDDGVQLFEGAQFFTSAAMFVELHPVPESVPIQNIGARSDGANVQVADAAKSDLVPIRATVGVSIESRGDKRRTPVTVARVNAKPRLDGEKARQQGLAESAVSIEGDPVAIAWAQSDKGGGMPPALSRVGIAYTEVGSRPRHDVRPAHTKRDYGDGSDGRGQRDDRSDEMYAYYEEEDA